MAGCPRRTPNNGTAADAQISDSLILHILCAPLMPGVSRFLNMRVVREIVSADGKNRLVIYERDDGLFTFVDERNAAEPTSPEWERVSNPASLYDSVETVMREAGSRVEWLRKQMTWPARDNPPAGIVPRRGGIIDCPYCGITFLIKDRDRWGGGRHLTCGQRIDLLDGQ